MVAQVDKSSGVNIHLKENAMKTPPQIIYSTSNELLITVPGATPQDDPVNRHRPLPYHFCMSHVLRRSRLLCPSNFRC